MPRIRLEAGQYGWDFLLVRVGKRDLDEDRDTVLVQRDLDYPGVAVTFGWTPCKRCRDTGANETDGTVNCHHRYASAMIRDAGRFLRRHVGRVREDPGYLPE